MTRFSWAIAWRQRLMVGVLLLSLIGLGGCDLVMALLLETGDPAANLPPCVNDDCNCGDFISQPQAQRVLEAFQNDPYQLDQDRNGQACEQLPAVAPTPDPPAPPSANPHLVLGNPSNASSTNPNNYLIERSQYALSYSRDRRVANWASWHVDASWLGRTERQDNFRPDGGLPAGFYQVTSNDYRGSGYDRGHIVPSGDRTASVKDNAATFLMTNIMPQAPDNNRGIWRALEEYTRDLVYQYDRDVYVIAGSYGLRETIGERAIVVPSRLWKVIVLLDSPGSGLAGVSADSQVIAVDMPNQNNLSDDWRRYQTTIDSIEIATGYDLLSNVPPAIQAVIEARTQP